MSELYDILTETPPTKVVLLALDQGLWDCERSLAELAALCEANHMEAVAQISQKRQTPETGTPFQGRLFPQTFFPFSREAFLRAFPLDIPRKIWYDTEKQERF